MASDEPRRDVVDAARREADEKGHAAAFVEEVDGRLRCSEMHGDEARDRQQHHFNHDSWKLHRSPRMAQQWAQFGAKYDTIGVAGESCGDRLKWHAAQEIEPTAARLVPSPASREGGTRMRTIIMATATAVSLLFCVAGSSPSQAAPVGPIGGPRLAEDWFERNRRDAILLRRTTILLVSGRMAWSRLVLVRLCVAARLWLGRWIWMAWLGRTTARSTASCPSWRARSEA